MSIENEKRVDSMLTDLPSDSNSTENGQVISDHPGLHRGLKSRHVQLIALGGCIGTGLFVGSGAALYNSGPASLFLSYCIVSIFKLVAS